MDRKSYPSYDFDSSCAYCNINLSDDLLINIKRDPISGNSPLCMKCYEEAENGVQELCLGIANWEVDTKTCKEYEIRIQDEIDDKELNNKLKKIQFGSMSCRKELWKLVRTISFEELEKIAQADQAVFLEESCGEHFYRGTSWEDKKNGKEGLIFQPERLNHSGKERKWEPFVGGDDQQLYFSHSEEDARAFGTGFMHDVDGERFRIHHAVVMADNEDFDDELKEKLESGACGVFSLLTLAFDKIMSRQNEKRTLNITGCEWTYYYSPLFYHIYKVKFPGVNSYTGFMKATL